MRIVCNSDNQCAVSYTHLDVYKRQVLSRHKFIHAGIKECRSDVCNKPFKWAWGLATRKLIHTGVEHYRCDVCNKTFTRPHDVSNHKIIHNVNITVIFVIKCLLEHVM